MRHVRQQAMRKLVPYQNVLTGSYPFALAAHPRQRRQLPTSAIGAARPLTERDSDAEKRVPWRRETAARLELTPREAEVLTDEDYEYLEFRAQQASVTDISSTK